MKNVTFIRTITQMADELMAAVNTIKGKVVVIGNMVQVTGISRYDDKQVKVLTDNGFSMVEDYEFESRI